MRLALNMTKKIDANREQNLGYVSFFIKNKHIH